jgi:hypothetical protein
MVMSDKQEKNMNQTEDEKNAQAAVIEQLKSIFAPSDDENLGDDDPDDVDEAPVISDEEINKYLSDDFRMNWLSDLGYASSQGLKELASYILSTDIVEAQLKGIRNIVRHYLETEDEGVEVSLQSLPGDLQFQLRSLAQSLVRKAAKNPEYQRYEDACRKVVQAIEPEPKYWLDAAAGFMGLDVAVASMRVAAEEIKFTFVQRVGNLLQELETQTRTRTLVAYSAGTGSATSSRPELEFRNVLLKESEKFLLEKEWHTPSNGWKEAVSTFLRRFAPDSELVNGLLEADQSAGEGDTQLRQKLELVRILVGTRLEELVQTLTADGKTLDKTQRLMRLHLVVAMERKGDSQIGRTGSAIFPVASNPPALMRVSASPLRSSDKRTPGARAFLSIKSLLSFRYDMPFLESVSLAQKSLSEFNQELEFDTVLDVSPCDTNNLPTIREIYGNSVSGAILVALLETRGAYLFNKNCIYSFGITEEIDDDSISYKPTVVGIENKINVIEPNSIFVVAQELSPIEQKSLLEKRIKDCRIEDLKGSEEDGERNRITGLLDNKVRRTFFLPYAPSAVPIRFQPSPELRHLLLGQLSETQQFSLLVGESGSGKSTALNAVLPEFVEQSLSIDKPFHGCVTIDFRSEREGWREKLCSLFDQFLDIPDDEEVNQKVKSQNYEEYINKRLASIVKKLRDQKNRYLLIFENTEMILGDASVSSIDAHQITDIRLKDFLQELGERETYLSVVALSTELPLLPPSWNGRYEVIRFNQKFSNIQHFEHFKTRLKGKFKSIFDTVTLFDDPISHERIVDIIHDEYGLDKEQEIVEKTLVSWREKGFLIEKYDGSRTYVELPSTYKASAFSKLVGSNEGQILCKKIAKYCSDCLSGYGDFSSASVSAFYNFESEEFTTLSRSWVRCLTYGYENTEDNRRKYLLQWLKFLFSSVIWWGEYTDFPAMTAFLELWKKTPYHYEGDPIYEYCEEFIKKYPKGNNWRLRHEQKREWRRIAEDLTDLKKSLGLDDPDYPDIDQDPDGYFVRAAIEDYLAEALWYSGDKKQAESFYITSINAYWNYSGTRWVAGYNHTELAEFYLDDKKVDRSFDALQQCFYAYSKINIQHNDDKDEEDEGDNARYEPFSDEEIEEFIDYQNDGDTHEDFEPYVWLWRILGDTLHRFGRDDSAWKSWILSVWFCCRENAFPVVKGPDNYTIKFYQEITGRILQRLEELPIEQAVQRARQLSDFWKDIGWNDLWENIQKGENDITYPVLPFDERIAKPELENLKGLALVAQEIFLDTKSHPLRSQLFPSDPAFEDRFYTRAIQLLGQTDASLAVVNELCHDVLEAMKELLSEEEPNRE